MKGEKRGLPMRPRNDGAGANSRDGGNVMMIFAWCV